MIFRLNYTDDQMLRDWMRAKLVWQTECAADLDDRSKVSLLHELLDLFDSLVKVTHNSVSMDPDTLYDATPGETRELFVWFLRRFKNEGDLPNYGCRMLEHYDWLDAERKRLAAESSQDVQD